MKPGASGEDRAPGFEGQDERGAVVHGERRDASAITALSNQAPLKIIRARWREIDPN